MSAPVTIARIETVQVDVPLTPALAVHGAGGLHDRCPFVLVRVTTSEGVRGYGEVTCTPFWSGEDAVSATHFVRDVIRPLLVGQPLEPVAAHHARMDAALRLNHFTKAGTATALWDALARTLDVPLVTLLGGAVRTDVPIKLSVSGGERLAAAYEAGVARGFEAFKLKVGFEPRNDARSFGDLRRMAGEDATIGLDANAGWSRAAAAAAVHLSRADRPAFLEQPVAADDLDGLRALRGGPARVLADESVFTMHDLRRLIEADAADAVSIYVGKSGGPDRAVAQAHVAGAFGLEVVLGSNVETDIGAAAQLHAACAMAALSTDLPSDIAGPLYQEHRVVETPLRIDGRFAYLPAGPGLGVDPIDELERAFA